LLGAIQASVTGVYNNPVMQIPEPRMVAVTKFRSDCMGTSKASSARSKGRFMKAQILFAALLLTGCANYGGGYGGGGYGYPGYGYGYPGYGYRPPPPPPRYPSYDPNYWKGWSKGAQKAAAPPEVKYWQGWTKPNSKPKKKSK